MKFKEFTLSYAIRDNRVLLPLKIKEGVFASGLHNGVGGKCEPHEPHWLCMIRENWEEQRIIPTRFERAGHLYIRRDYNGADTFAHVSLWVVRDFFGKPTETNEMKPYWFDFDKLPYDRMLDDQKTILPQILKGKKPIITLGVDKG